MPTLPAVLILTLLAAPPISTDSPQPPPPQHTPRPTRFIAAGSTGLGLGVMMLAFMGVSLRRGDAQRVAHNDVIHGATGHQRPLTAAEREQLASIDHLGRIDNHSAIGFAIAGAVATIVGAVLLGRGVQLRRRASLAWSPTPRGAGLTLRF